MAIQIAQATIWEKVIELVNRKTNFKNWSLSSGWLETEFDLKLKNSFEIEVLPSRNRLGHIMPKIAFEKMAREWNNYKTGKVSRQELKKLSRHAAYVLAILKSIEDGE